MLRNIFHTKKILYIIYICRNDRQADRNLLETIILEDLEALQMAKNHCKRFKLEQRTNLTKQVLFRLSYQRYK